ncbi:MAG: hypothetical protein ACYTGZ_06455 [Planctomycetota bacterium]|jgi:hypothetical protein
MADYKLGKRAQECAGTGEPFGEGEEIVSAIFQTDEGFERRDYSVTAFGEVADSHSFWRGRVPVTVEDARRLDYDLAFEFFQRLRAENDEAQAPLVYLLGLLLARKRKLKMKGFARISSGEILRVVVRGDEEDEEVEIPVPLLEEGAAERLQADLNRLFGIELPGVPEEPAEPDSVEKSGEEPPSTPPFGAESSSAE